MSGNAQISTDILARYARDAATDVTGVRGVVDGHLPRRGGVRVSADEGTVAVELHLALDWGASIPDVGRAVQQRVADYLEKMADARPSRVDVVVVELGPAA